MAGRGRQRGRRQMLQVDCFLLQKCGANRAVLIAKNRLARKICAANDRPLCSGTAAACILSTRCRAGAEIPAGTDSCRIFPDIGGMPPEKPAGQQGRVCASAHKRPGGAQKTRETRRPSGEKSKKKPGLQDFIVQIAKIRAGLVDAHRARVYNGAHGWQTEPEQRAQWRAWCSGCVLRLFGAAANSRDGGDLYESTGKPCGAGRGD